MSSAAINAFFSNANYTSAGRYTGPSFANGSARYSGPAAAPGSSTAALGAQIAAFFTNANYDSAGRYHGPAADPVAAASGPKTTSASDARLLTGADREGSMAAALAALRPATPAPTGHPPVTLRRPRRS